MSSWEAEKRQLTASFASNAVLPSEPAAASAEAETSGCEQSCSFVNDAAQNASSHADPSSVRNSAATSPARVVTSEGCDAAAAPPERAPPRAPSPAASKCASATRHEARSKGGSDARSGVVWPIHSRSHGGDTPSRDTERATVARLRARMRERSCLGARRLSDVAREVKKT